jgi:hypothetical protein
MNELGDNVRQQQNPLRDFLKCLTASRETKKAGFRKKLVA